MKSSQDGIPPGTSSTSSALFGLLVHQAHACESAIRLPDRDQVLRAHPGSPDSPPRGGSVQTLPGYLPPSALIPRCEPKALTVQFEAATPRSDKKGPPAVGDPLCLFVNQSKSVKPKPQSVRQNVQPGLFVERSRTEGLSPTP